MLYIVTALRKLDTMVELGKMPKEALVYSGPTYYNNNLTANYALKENRRGLQWTLYWKRELLMTVA